MVSRKRRLKSSGASLCDTVHFDVSDPWAKAPRLSSMVALRPRHQNGQTLVSAQRCFRSLSSWPIRSRQRSANFHPSPLSSPTGFWANRPGSVRPIPCFPDRWHHEPAIQFKHGYELVPCSRSCCRARRGHCLAVQPSCGRHPLFHRLARLHHPRRLRAADETSPAAAAGPQAAHLEYPDPVPARAPSAGCIKSAGCLSEPPASSSRRAGVQT